MIIDDIGGGSAEETGDFLVRGLAACGDEAGETESGITGGVFLVIGGFVGLVDDDEAEIMDGGKESGTGADDDDGVAGGGFGEDTEPSFAAFGGGLVGVDEVDTGAESLLENLDELGGEGDFGNEEDGGVLRFKGISGHFEVDIGFTATGYTSEETSGSWGF